MPAVNRAYRYNDGGLTPEVLGHELILEAKRRGFDVSDYEFLGDDANFGPMFILVGKDRVGGWYSKNGDPVISKDMTTGLFKKSKLK